VKRLNWQSDELVDRLGRKFGPPAFAFLPQLRNGTGFARHTNRTADAVAFSVWPSRGLHLYGFEIKVGRGDWLMELRDPEKAEGIQQFCTFWYLVAPKDVVDLSEVPPYWGLLTPEGVGLKTVKTAIETTPKPLDTLMVASILRNAAGSIPYFKNDYIHVSKVDEQVEERADILAKRSVTDFSVERYRQLEKDVAAFETASGLDISMPWPHKTGVIGAAVKVILDDRSDAISRLSSEAKGLRTIADRIDAVVKSLRDMERCPESVAPRNGPLDPAEPDPGETGARPPAR
jgi:hypothetical protein